MMPAGAERPIPTPAELRALAGACLERVRKQRPAVHCITNTVSANTVANALLALGVEPSMTSSLDEVADFVRTANAVSINLGTLDGPLREAIICAIETANACQIPWQLDPVFVQRSASRLAFARQLIPLQPRVIRANHAEMQALSGSGQTLAQYSQACAATLAVTGKKGPGC